jgi:hypothetical protein
LKQLQIVGKILEYIGIGNKFLTRTEKAQHLRERMNKLDCIKLKSFCTAKEIVTRLKRLPTEWEKIIASYSSLGANIQNLQETKKTQPLKNQYHSEEMNT